MRRDAGARPSARPMVLRFPEAGFAWIAMLAGLLLVGLATPALGQTGDLRGTWETHSRDSRRTGEAYVQLQLEIDRSGRGQWQTGFGILAEDLRGISPQQLRGDLPEARFELVREAGTLSFEGEIRNGRGTGFFTFTPSATYLKEMAQLGYPGLSPERQLGFTVHDVTTEYVRGLRQLGYTALAVDDLGRFAIHGVSLRFVGELNALGYEEIAPDRLVKLRIHGVTPEYVRQVRAALGLR